MKKSMTLGERAADIFSAKMGSWPFVIAQTIILAAWVVWNSYNGKSFDPYPYILLNLVLSFQAAYAAPIIMMSQNRQSSIDRITLNKDLSLEQHVSKEVDTLRKDLLEIKGMFK